MANFLFGVGTGVVVVLYLFAFHQKDPVLILNPLIYWSTLLITTLGMILAVRRKKNLQGGMIERKDALRAAFLVYLIATLIFSLFTYVLFNYINTNLPDLQRQMMENAGRNVKDLDFKMTFGRVMTGYAFSLIGGFFIAWLVALLLKKEPYRK